MEATRLVATGAATTVTVVLVLAVVSSAEVAVMVTVPGLAGAVQTPPEVMVPPVADQVTVLVAPPLARTLKVLLVATVTVGVLGRMEPRLTPTGVRVRVLVAVVPRLLVTVRVKVLVAVMGPELKGTPLVTAPIPWSTDPVPALKVGVMVVEPP